MPPLRLLLCLLFASSACSRALDIPFTLTDPATTSAGIYSAEGRLVTVLWTMRELPAGRHSATWDATTPGDYHLKVVVASRATYTNVGAIGNSGQPPDTKGHVPTNIESVAVDRDGNVYTANGWDEAGADFKAWSPDGKPLFDAGFVIRNGRPNGAPYAIAVDDEYIYCAVGGWEREPWNNRQQIQRFRRTDGKPAPFTGPSEKSSADEPKPKPPRVPKGPSETLLDGHIQLYEWPALQIPADTPEADVRLMKAPLRAIDVAGPTLYVADALGGKVRMFDSATGAPKGDFTVHLPTALAVDPLGQIWVATGHDTVKAFRADGYSGVTYGGFEDVIALAFGPGATLYAADAKAGRVLKLDPAASPAQFVPVLGSRAKSGDRAPDRFYKLRGLALDNQDNLFTVQREPGNSGARLARWSPDRKLLWEHFATEFVSLGNYGLSDPDTLYTISHHRHKLLDRAKGVWEYLGNSIDLANFPTSDNTYRADPHGVPRVLRIGRADFVFMPTGDGVQVYRVDGPVLKLASLVGGNDPSPTGDKGKSKVTRWTWSDTTGAAKPDPARIKAIDDHYTCFGMDVDARAGIWFANTHTHSVWQIPLGGVDDRGNPTYDWRDTREIIPRDTSPLGFDPTMANAAADGSIYAFGWSKPHPPPKNNPFWMGGTSLARFTPQGKLLWCVPLPETCVGMDPLPPANPAHPSVGGVLVGAGKSAKIYHYTQDGLLIGTLEPGAAMGKQSGWLDNHASVAANRDPRDGIVDVFAEEDFACRIAWYRLDDRTIRTINVPLPKP